MHRCDWLATSVTEGFSSTWYTDSHNNNSNTLTRTTTTATHCHEHACTYTVWRAVDLAVRSRAGRTPWLMLKQLDWSVDCMSQVNFFLAESEGYDMTLFVWFGWYSWPKMSFKTAQEFLSVSLEITFHQWSLFTTASFSENESAKYAFFQLKGEQLYAHASFSLPF